MSFYLQGLQELPCNRFVWSCKYANWVLLTEMEEKRLASLRINRLIQGTCICNRSGDNNYCRHFRSRHYKAYASLLTFPSILAKKTGSGCEAQASGRDRYFDKRI